MGLKGTKKNLAWPLAVLALFSLSLSARGGTLSGEVAGPETPGAAAQQPPVDDDAPGFIRNNTWSGSFDRAGDATRAAELELKTTNVECSEDKFKTDNATPEVVAQRMAECQQAQRDAQVYAQDAESIRKMQRTFAHVSRASDIAAVGAIGAVGYAQLIKKDESQAATMEGVAKIQETAGYVSYATGAADISMGAYALAVQKSKLEKMNKALSGVSKSGMKLSQADSALVTKIKNAAEQTHKAAVSHMAYGAGKVAVGYASMYLADKNRQIAASLGSIDPYATAVAPVAASTPYVNQGANGTVYYQNNQPNIALPDGTSTSSDNTDTASTGSFTGAGGGASVMPSPDGRQPSSLGKGGGVGGLGGSAGGAKSSGPESPLEASAEPEKAKDPAAPETGLNLSGGGGSRYGGGGTAAADEGAPVAQVLDSGSANSKATGVNPNSLYRDAMEGIDEDQAQASMAGVSGSAKSLFQVVKLKYNKMMEVGRLQGPGAVEVRN